MRYPVIAAALFTFTATLTFSQQARAADPLTHLSDEFSQMSTLPNWRLLDKVEGTPRPYSRLDISRSRAGFLTIVPVTSSWYMNDTGTLLFKTVSGNFIVTTSVITRSASNPSSPPRHPFNSAGLIARDPNSTSGNQNWVVCNVGMQQSATGSEVKTTRNSSSELHLENGPHDGQVRIARMGSTFTLLRRLKGESQWRVLSTMSRPDLPDTLQVGVMCNGYQSADLIAHYDYVHFATPHSETDFAK